jgi:cellulose synthase/poly-beta-1,6-N-acetylglucosamine synthase-like glycosyltransferase
MSEIIRSLSYILIIMGLLLWLTKYLFKNQNHMHLIKYEHHNNFCILIPARYEAKVLENLLISIENQSLKISNNNVYVIIESLNDPAINIIKNHQVNYIMRNDLNEARKGYALNDAIKYIVKNHHYDAYFIFDADNILDKDYLLNMSSTLSQGYDIGIGYRNTKNGNYSLIAAASSLTFSMINTYENVSRIKTNRTLTISGTGFYIKGDIVESWGIYPFHSLTEDYELTLYATLNELTTGYNESAIYYDEQPIKYNDSIIERTRWIKGYFEARKKYIPLFRKQLFKKSNNLNSLVTELIGVTDYIMLLIGLFLLIITNINNYLTILTLLLILYLILFIFTIILLTKEQGKLNINRNMKIKLMFFNPIFLISYIRCALIALFNPHLEWKKIDHNINNIEK